MSGTPEEQSAAILLHEEKTKVARALHQQIWVIIEDTLSCPIKDHFEVGWVADGSNERAQQNRIHDALWRALAARTAWEQHIELSRLVAHLINEHDLYDGDYTIDNVTKAVIANALEDPATQRGLQRAISIIPLVEPKLDLQVYERDFPANLNYYCRGVIIGDFEPDDEKVDEAIWDAAQAIFTRVKSCPFHEFLSTILSGIDRSDRS